MIYERILVTGGCGFIGANFIRRLMRRADFTGVVVNVDKLTYAGNRMSVADIEEQFGGSRYIFEQKDIADYAAMEEIVERYGISCIVNFAAESHVDRSIYGPAEFVRTNVIGTFSLLESARKAWKGRKDVRFHQVSTDEVYGPLGEEGFFTEITPYAPANPYAATKASADHLVRAYANTYGLPVTISNCCNNYGPYQFPEKLVPFMILAMCEGRPLPVYGDGGHIRDWLYVEDHCDAICLILEQGVPGETYLVGGGNERRNRDLVIELCKLVALRTGRDPEEYERLITYVSDRPGHDRRYAIDSGKIRRELGWSQAVSLEEGLARTVDWYLSNRQWVDAVKTGAYREWVRTNYDGR